ncbi:HAMP domain-containing histidine kinase [Paenibacillus tritici]|uniref:sensor histidine kinase n=1 Tax=Paenibacillus tritici TaxID=1873425 RepID=UPI001BAA4981|nr:HAMP domain-containing sensor histidine kinase [Paenibacillus tritici]QUL52164.1 HAMP domain-containing histidine kinase [Paenibacillus tritici]
MSVRRRLMTRFIGLLAGTVILILVIGGSIAYWVIQQLNEASLVEDFATVGLDQLISTAEILPDGSVKYDPGLLKRIEENKGWLQILDEQGRVLDAFHTPPDVPNHYKPGELISYWQGQKPFPYQLYLLIRERKGINFTLLYGESNQAVSMLEQTYNGGRYANNKLELAPMQQDIIRTADAYLQILDEQGRVITSFNKPATGIPDSYSIQDLILRTRYPARYGVTTVTSYDEQNHSTWMLSVPLGSNPAGSNENPFGFILGPALIALLVSIISLLILLAVWYANLFGYPMLHMLQWLQRLERGQYEEPAGPRGRPLSQKKNGKWRRNYRVYTEVLHSIQTLSNTLRQDKELRRQTDSLREEWIAGITHDLKTPLSSIQGYAHMLEAEKYQWTSEEVREFAGIMLDKSMYMDRLVNDLAMTYRLRSGGYQPPIELTDINTLLQDLVHRAERNPAYGEGRITFQPAQIEVQGHVHIPSFERIVDNLTANALLHNPPDTKLIVSVQSGEEAGDFIVQFTDNGRGMDQETVWKLFERYYRGTDTGAPDVGSGLGMAVTKGLIEAMQGRIEVCSNPKEGTQIRLIWDVHSRTGTK